MRGKTALITGFTQGIGKATALELLRLGAKLVLVARDQARGAAVVDEIKKEAGGGDVELVIADLSAQADVRRVAGEVKGPLHVLVNNAGAIHQTRKVSPDGIEMTFATNHLAYFLLTDLLLPKLEEAGAARVVNVASGAHTRGTMDLDDVGFERTGYTPFRAYGRSKLANIMFTYELARRLAAKGSKVTANALHPGVVRTGFGRNDPGIFKLVIRIASPFFLTPEKGARTTIYLASSPEVEGVTGKYFYKCQPVRSNRESMDEAKQKGLWELSEKLVGASPRGTEKT